MGLGRPELTGASPSGSRDRRHQPGYQQLLGVQDLGCLGQVSGIQACAPDHESGALPSSKSPAYQRKRHYDYHPSCNMTAYSPWRCLGSYRSPPLCTPRLVDAGLSGANHKEGGYARE